MAVEIERKFLVMNDDWRVAATDATHIVQGYLVSSPELTIRARVRGDQAFLTIKGATIGISRPEYEYEIPVAEALAMLTDMAVSPVIEKVRHLVPVSGTTWEVDVFEGDNTGLIMAEVELADAEQRVELPTWAGKEVSGDPRFYNVFLAANPYRSWPEGGQD